MAKLTASAHTAQRVYGEGKERRGSQRLRAGIAEQRLRWTPHSAGLWLSCAGLPVTPQDQASADNPGHSLFSAESGIRRTMVSPRLEASYNCKFSKSWSDYSAEAGMS